MLSDRFRREMYINLTQGIEISSVLQTSRDVTQVSRYSQQYLADTVL